MLISNGIWAGGAIMLDGESLLQQGPELALLSGWCVVAFGIALKIFRWE